MQNTKFTWFTPLAPFADQDMSRRGFPRGNADLSA